jgi:signal transduction histidine kinase
MSTQAVLEKETPVSDLCRQKSVFSIITVLIIGVLLLLHAMFASVLGRPSIHVVGLLGLGLLLAVFELIWLRQGRNRPTESAIKIESSISIVALFALTALLTYFTNRDENPYFVLLAIPVVQCAYVFGLFSTILTIAAADGMIFFWLDYFFALHPPARVTQYLEGGMLSAIYVQMGLLVWVLVNRLKNNQGRLAATLHDLRATREQLIREEKLAAVGRLASGIAHEIRNPVAMISSSLSTASQPGTDVEVRDEMFAIATQESKRLEHLTSDFLAYARPAAPNRSPVLMKELLAYAANVTKAHAARRSITVMSEVVEEFPMEIDVPQIEGALLNLVLNAIDAERDKGTVKLKATMSSGLLSVDVENSGPAIPEGNLDRIFEPFFTTKPNGTGLGLAIARGAARAHGGDVWLSSNQDGCVTFSMTLRRDTL